MNRNQANANSAGYLPNQVNCGSQKISTDRIIHHTNLFSSKHRVTDMGVFSGESARRFKVGVVWEQFEFEINLTASQHASIYLVWLPTPVRLEALQRE